MKKAEALELKIGDKVRRKGSKETYLVAGFPSQYWNRPGGSKIDVVISCRKDVHHYSFKHYEIEKVKEAPYAQPLHRS